MAGVTQEGDMTSSGGADEWDFVVPADGDELLAELDRHGVKPGQRVHVRPVPGVGVEGILAGSGPVPTWEDFEEASRLAAADAEASGTLPE
jgi:hypothetical protein